MTMKSMITKTNSILGEVLGPLVVGSASKFKLLELIL